ncbi:MAG: glycosyltransferase family 39 protein [Flavobacteriales bacterium]|nr:glycosyltransferase family 39 protein [Flavobacteriales bacterium]
MLFAINKIKYLGLPYFWDEAWVYAPAVFDMFENGPSLSPNSIDPLLSRGHPILFHFLAVCWMTIFGTSFTAVHSFSVFVAVLLIVAVYKLGEALASKSVGFWSAALLAMQPIFIQQAGFLLPEIMLALFVTLTVLFYLKRKMWLYLAAGSAMLLTKETGILVIGMLGLVELFEFVRNREFTIRRLVETLWVGSPVAIAFLYFLAQYMQFGWFMFPEHVSMFETDPEIWLKKREIVFRLFFLEQHRYIIVSVVLAVAAFGWRKAHNVLRVFYLMILLTTVTMNGLESWLPTWYYENVFPLILIITIIWTGAYLKKEGTKNHLFFPFVGLIVTAMLIFTSTHFIIGRYLLYLIPLLFLALAVLAYTALKENRGLFQMSMLCLGLMFYHLANRADAKLSTLDNMHYVDQIHVLQKGIEYLETETEFSECVAGSFLIQQALMFPVQGYVTEDNKPACVKNHVAPEAQYVMLISYEPDANLEWVKVDKNFVQVFAETRGRFSAWVYKRIGG